MSWTIQPPLTRRPRLRHSSASVRGRSLAGRFFSELKQRNVIRVAGVYAVTAWALFQIAKTVFETLGLPRWAPALVLALLTLGLPVALIIAWAFERGPDGRIVRTPAPH